MRSLYDAVKELLDNRSSDYLHADDREMLMAALPTVPLGRAVKKRGGDYQFDGQIIAEVEKLSGERRYVVEDDRGLLLIMNSKQVSS